MNQEPGNCSFQRKKGWGMGRGPWEEVWMQTIDDGYRKHRVGSLTPGMAWAKGLWRPKVK